MRAWQDITHYDMTYFFKDVLEGIDQSVVDQYKPTDDYPVFVPISSVYQTSRSYNYDGEKRYSSTMQPYDIPYGEDFTIDLGKYTVSAGGQYESGSIVYPSGFTHRVKKILQPEHGTITKVDDTHYKFSPGNDVCSGKITVTIELTKTDGAFEVEDIDLILELNQSHETKKMVLERTTYTFDSDKIPSNAIEAFTSNYEGNSGVTKIDHSNPTQNANADIWLIPDPDNTGVSSSFPNAKPEHFLPDTPTPDRVMEISGKLFFPEAGKYRVYLRGRFDCAVFLSFDGNDYSKYSAFINDPTNTVLFRLSDPNSYIDIDLEEDNTFVYFKEVLMVKNSSFIGLGTGQWTKPTFTITTIYYDKDGNEITEAEASELEGSYSKNVYYDSQGMEVSEEEANNAHLEPPTAAQYANGYRSSYEIINEEFETDYFYIKNYSYSYTDNVLQSKDQDGEYQKIVKITESGEKDGVYQGYTPALHKPENACDGNRETYVHSRNPVSDSNVLTLVLDLNEAKAVNRMIIWSQVRGDYMIPNKFTLRGSMDGIEFFNIGDFSDVALANYAATVDFEEKIFRYYELAITGSSDRYAIISEIDMWRIFEISGMNNMIVPDSDKITYEGVWAGVQTQSHFGHIYIGAPGATATVEFTGTRVCFISSTEYDTDFEVYIDGNKVESIKLKEDDGGYRVSYLCDKLESGKHTAVLRCVGKGNIDSVITFEEN